MSIFDPATPSSEREGRKVPSPKTVQKASQPQQEMELPPAPALPRVTSPEQQPQELMEEQAPPIQEAPQPQEAPPQEGTPQTQEGTPEQQQQASGMINPVLPVNPSRYYDVHGFNTGIDDASNRLNNHLAEQQGSLSIEQILANTKGTPYNLPENSAYQDLSIDLEGSIERTQALRAEAEENIRKYNFRRDYGIEYNNAVIHEDGSVTPKTPTISTDVQQNGVQSNIGEVLEENKSNRLFTGIINSPLGKYLTDHGDYKPLVGVANQLDPRAIKLGENTVGLGTVVGLGLKVLNTVESVMVGAVYDVVDNTVMRIHNEGKDPHKGSRVWQALIEGKDWGVSNRWTPEKYLSWNEPEGFKAGDIVDDEFWNKPENQSTPEALRRTATISWNLPENLAKSVTKSESGVVSRSLHWVLQGIPSYSFEVFTGGVADKLVSKGITAASPVAKTVENLLKTGSITQETTSAIVKLSDDIPLVPHRVTRNIDNVEPGITVEGGLAKYVTPDKGRLVEIPVTPKVVDAVDGEFVARPSDYIIRQIDKSKLADNKLLNPANSVENVIRNNSELTRIGKMTYSSDNLPVVHPRMERSLTNTEIGALKTGDLGDTLGEYGTKVRPDLEYTTHLEMPDGTLVQTPRYPRPPEIGHDEVLGISNDNARRVYQDLTDDIKTKPNASLDTLSVIEQKRQVALAKLADNGEAYDVVKKDLPTELQSESVTVIDEGNRMISSQIQLSGESAEAVRLDEQIREISRVSQDLKQQMTLYPLHRGDLTVEKTTREASTGIIDDSISITDDIIDVPKSRNTKLNEDLLRYDQPDGTPPERGLTELLTEKQGVSPKPNKLLVDDLNYKDTRSLTDYTRQRAISENVVDSKIEELLPQYRADWEAGGRKGFNTTKESQINQFVPYVKLKDSQIKKFDIDLARESLVKDGVDVADMDDATIATLASYHNQYPRSDLNKIRLYDSIEDVPNDIEKHFTTDASVTDDEFARVAKGETKLRSVGNKNLLGLPELEHTQDWVQKTWKHGTTSTGDVRRMIPREGGSANEFGMGIYLTLNDDVAKSAAIKGDLPNKQFARTVADNVAEPRLHTVNVDSLSNVLKGSDPMGSKIRRQWHIASSISTEEFGLGSKSLDLPKGTKIEDMFNTWKIEYYNKYGEVPSELVNNKFNERLTFFLEEMGYEGLYSNKNGIETLVVYKPHQLDVVSTVPVPKTNSIGEVLEAKRYLESVTAEQLGDDVSIANKIKAQKEFNDYQLQNAVEERLLKEQKMTELVDDIFTSEDTIVKHTIENSKSNENFLETRFPKEVADQNEPLDQIRRSPC